MLSFDNTLIPVGFDGTAGASEGDQSGSEGSGAGASDDGSGGGTDAAAQAAAEQLAKAQEELRSTQSGRDKLRSEVEALEARKAELTRETTSDGGEQDKPLTQADFVRMLDERERKATHKTTMTETAAKLREQFRHADPGILDRAASYSSVESLTEAAKASHERVVGVVEGEVQNAIQAIAKEHGIRLASPVDGGQAPSGDPTLAQLNAMSMEEFNRVPAETVERVLRSAEQER